MRECEDQSLVYSVSGSMFVDLLVKNQDPHIRKQHGKAVAMETLESSCMCRLCGKQSGISIDIFDKNENHIKKINAILPILVHEMDMLPKHMCHRCSYKVEEFHKFYVDCLKTDANLKSQLSWMRKRDNTEENKIPMVQIENVKIKTEPPDYDIYELDPIIENVNYINSMSSVTFPRVHANGMIARGVNDANEQFVYDTFANCAHCRCNCDKKDQTMEAVIKDCTKRKSRYSVDKNLGNVNLDWSSKISRTTVSLNDVLMDTQRDILGRHTLRNVQNHKSTVAKEMSALNVENILNASNVNVTEINEKTFNNVEVRHLRPRKRSVDYVGRKQKISYGSRSNYKSRSRDIDIKSINISNAEDSGTVKIKVEKSDDIERRILRPRKKLINYLGTKRKSSSRLVVDSVQRSKNKKCYSKRYKFCTDTEGTLTPNPYNEEFNSAEEGTKESISKTFELTVKQEMFSDPEDSTTKQIIDSELQVKARMNGCMRNLSEAFDAMPKTMLITVKKDVSSSRIANGKQIRCSADLTNKSKSLMKVTKNKLKSGKLEKKRISNKNAHHLLKHLRSQDAYLRNGKIKELNGVNGSMRNFRKTVQNISTRKGMANKYLPNTIKGSGRMIRIPASVKSVNSVKYFCTKCSISFMNKELFSLHACCYD